MMSASSQWVVGNRIHTLKMLRHSCTTKKYKNSNFQLTLAKTHNMAKKNWTDEYSYVHFFLLIV